MDAAVASIVDGSTRASERWISSARAVFCVAAIVRRASFGGLWDGDRVPTGALVMVPAVAVTAAFSIWIVRRTRRPAFPRGLLYASVSIDAAVCFLALASNVLWPAAVYRGVLGHPDVAVLFLMITVAGFRLSTPVAVAGSILNAASLAALIALDHLLVPGQLHTTQGTPLIIVMCVAFTSATAIAVARRARSMAEDAATSSVRADRARRGLETVIEEHHDLKSTLGSALLNAELMARELDERGALDAGHRVHADRLREDLGAAQRVLRSLRADALAEAAALEVVDDVDVASAFTRAARVVAARFPDVAIDVEVSAFARVAGGAIALERVALNLLLNACEGDGTRGASRIRVEPAAGGVRVVDDGPGLSARPSGTTKTGGSGLGFRIVDAVVTASGGSWRIVPGAAGAAIELALPAR